MTDKAKLLELAKHVEKLDGPCRETDEEIARVTGWVETVYKTDCGTEKESLFHKWPSITKMQARYYTASIDDAMTLVPDGWEWDEGHTIRNEGDYVGQKHTLRRLTDGLILSGTSRSPANAIVAACLRAIAEEI